VKICAQVGEIHRAAWERSGKYSELSGKDQEINLVESGGTMMADTS
jgi:hypothetical protein